MRPWEINVLQIIIFIRTWTLMNNRHIKQIAICLVFGGTSKRGIHVQRNIISLLTAGLLSMQASSNENIF